MELVIKAADNSGCRAEIKKQHGLPELCKKYAYKKEQTIIANYKREIEQLNQQLDIQFLNAVIEIKESLRQFADLEKMAFDKNVNVAFTGSVELAMTVGVEKTQVLQSIEDIDTFFMS